MKFFISVCIFCVSGLSFAECLTSMSEEKLIECIMIEGSGTNYQDWLTQHNKPVGTDSKLVSTITGDDIRELKPSAGSINQ